MQNDVVNFFKSIIDKRSFIDAASGSN